MVKSRHGTTLAALLAMALIASGSAIAQTTSTTDVRNFEVISVDGNQLVVKDQHGTQEYTVPADFRFTVNGKSLAVGELKAGMKGTATITTTTTVRPVYVTTVKKGEVLSQVARSVVVRDVDTGTTRRFTQTETDARNIKLYMDGKPIQIAHLKKGDLFTATFVTASAPVVLTEKQVDAVLANPDAPVAAMAAEPEAAPEPVAQAQAEAPMETPPASETAPDAEPVAAAAEAEPATAPAPAEEPTKLWVWILLLLVLALVVWLIARNRKKS